MKSFNRLREESLEEKLKASDPTGKWISDFVHSDNPKFAGKSKKERIRMALGASYAAKRQNEDNNHIVEKYTENDIANGGTVIYKHAGKHYMSKVSHKTGAGAGTKIHTTSALGHVVPLHHVVSTDASDWNTYKNRPVKEEVEQVDELKKSTLASYVSKAAGAYGRDKQLIGRESPDGLVKNARPEMKRAVKNRLTGINRAAVKLSKEEVEIDEAAWGQDKMANLKAAHDRHSEKAIAANRAGDDQAVKVHQSKMNMIKNQMNRLRKEEVEQVHEAKHRVSVTVSEPDHAMVSKRKEQQQKFVRISGEKEGAVSKAQQHFKKQGYRVHGAEYVGTVNEDIEQIDELKRSTLASYVGKASKEIATAKSYAAKYKKDSEFERDVGHPSRARVLDTQKDVELKHAKKRQAGFDKALGRLAKEETQIDELKKSTLASYASKASKSASGLATNAMHHKNVLDAHTKLGNKKQSDQFHKYSFDATEKQIKRQKGVDSALKRLAKEEAELDEGSVQDKMYQQHQAIRTANKRPNPEYYRELGMAYDIKDDKERIAKQAEIKKKYKVEGAQLDQLKTMRDDPKWQENPEHKAQLDKRFKMAKDRADLDKGEVTDASGKPVPVLTPDKFKEKNPNFMKEEGEYPHQGVGVSRSMQMAADIARQKARASLMQSKYGAEFQDKAMPDYDEDKMDLKPGSAAGTYQATVRMRERLKQESFSSFRNKIAEAKKMKGEDPCWDDYKMIGTKMKNGKEVPNCVPKEETEIEGNTIEESKPGLYANIHAKRKRIAKGSGERMRKPGTKGAPTAQAFKDAAKTAKK